MRRQLDISQASFDAFLTWLDPDRERAGDKYEAIRRKLIKVFECRGCSSGEELADETINRVIRKASDLRSSYTGDPALYFYGVARNVYLERFRKTNPPPPPVLPHQDDLKERQFSCLDHCMGGLSPDNRDLVLGYYAEESENQIVRRKQLALRFGMAPTTLRVRVHRIRATLQVCVEDCLQRQEA